MRKTAAIPLVLVALLAEYGLASAQEKVDESKKQELKQVDPVPSTGQSPAGQAGTAEPSTKVTGTSPSTGGFVDGKLAVPGAATDGETVPSKYSAQNAALDKLPIVAFSLRLNDAQKREIHKTLHGGHGGLALSPAHAMVGAEIPAEIALRDLRPVPDSLIAKFPELRWTSYLIEGPNVLLTNANNMVVGVLSAQ
jgi:hypothetical protein